MWAYILSLVAFAAVSCSAAGAGAARLVCYAHGGRTDGYTECTHLVYTGDARGDRLDALLKEYRKNNARLKIILRVGDEDKDLRTLLKSKHVQGLEIHDAHKALNKTKVSEIVEAAKTAISSSGGGPLFLALPAHPELLAKYYDLRSLMKKVDLLMVQTHALGMVKKMTYHPSRLSGLWDMMNTDSVVDLVVGLGIPASKLVISLPATACQFTLMNETLSTPGSPAVDDEPKEIDQAELCRQLRKGRWTLERDQDLSAPYAFRDKTWISFEDSSSVDVKGKYARVRGLAGLALHQADRDVETPCGPTLKAALAKVLNQQSRAPRAAVLRSLEHEILSAPSHVRALDALQVSPYRITQVVDSDGVIHSIREDTRTEFSCSRQGYFVHPRSCARFYRCVKFDQLSPEYTVFEFDCPAGLAFDSRYEVCVWPGSLPHSQACPGSSEIAPVPRTRFICPQHEGYYADPENCRWFFACLDHGQAPLTAYEFRCPFGLGFDAEKLKCDWPWLVPACGNIARYEAEAYGYSGAALTGAAGFHGQTADAVNIAAHQSLVSGASLSNHVGIQGGYLTNDDILDSNFIASQQLNNDAYNGQGNSYQLGNTVSPGLVQATKYNDGGKYSSGSIILDDYRLPTAEEAARSKAHSGIGVASNLQGYSGQGYNGYSNQGYNGYSDLSSNQKSSRNQYDSDNSGQYVHDPTGDYAEPYRHVDSPVAPYVHDDSGYKQTGDYYDYGKYNGQYSHDQSGAYVDTGSSGYNTDYSGSYGGSGKYESGVYRADGHIGKSNGQKVTSAVNIEQYHVGYGNNAGSYLTDSNAYTGGSHTLTAGAVNVGLVGKTTLVDAIYADQNNYNSGAGTSFGHKVQHVYNKGHVPIISQPAVSINHLGTDGHNLDGYSFVTTPTASVVPTTATPFAVTTPIPVTTYRTTFVPEAPKSTVKDIFGYSQPPVTYVQPTVVAVKQYSTPKIEYGVYNQGNHQFNIKNENSEGYQYSKPSINFEDGITYTTPSPIVVSTFKPQGFSHTQQTVHKVESNGYGYSTPVPVTEEPFKKVVAYTTGPSIGISQPTVVTYTPQSFGHSTIHQVEGNSYSGNSYSSGESGYDYSKSSVSYEQPKVVQFSTPQPDVPALYFPQEFSHQTVHKVDTSQINTNSGDSGYHYEKPVSGYEYSKPAVKFEEVQKSFEYSTPASVVSHPVSFGHSTVHQVNAGQVKTYENVGSGYNYEKPSSGYEYSKPEVKFEDAKTVFEYSTPAPAVVSSYTPQTYSHQTIHQVETQKFIPVTSTVAPKVELSYNQPAVSVYQNPLLPYTENVSPATYVKSEPISYGHQTIHKVETSKTYVPAININSGFGSSVTYEAPKTVHYTTVQPTVASQVFSQQTLHNVDASKVNSFSEESGYNYEQPALKFEEAPKTIEYTTTAPIVSSYRPQTYSQQTIHKVEAQKFATFSSTPLPKVELTYQEPTVSIYENPIVKFTQNVTPKPTPAVYTHQVSHVIQPTQYESSQQNLELGQGYSYSQPEIQRNVEVYNTGKSYSDANVVSHQYYQQDNTKQAGKDVVFVSSTPANLIYEDHYAEYEAPKSYRAPEYIPPKAQYQSYSVSSTETPIVQQSVIQTQDQYDYKPEEYSQHYDTSKIQQTANEQPKIIESYHVSSFPGTTITTKYNQVPLQSPEVQTGYKSEEYLPPVVSTATPIVSSTYKSRNYATVSTTREYLPPTPETKYEYLPQQPEYNAPEYLPPSTTAKPKITYKTPEYLPPLETGTLNFDSYNYNNQDYSKISNNPYQEYTVSTAAPLKQNVVVQNAKSNLLGFGTVGPDAGLVSPVSYTTSAPIRSSSFQPAYVEVSTAAPTRKTRPRYKSTSPVYIESTTAYKAPDYLPPQEYAENDNYNSFGLKTYDASSTVQRKHNIVVENAKNVYLPPKQELVEVTPVPLRRTKPKVAVVTKVNDFNPLLVRKLGAVCSCQSPILVLKGTRPNVQVSQDFDDYGNDYYDSGRGDVSDSEWAQKSARIQNAVKTVTTAPYVKSTFNPIIVPDDSYYQDYQESLEVTPKNKQVYSDSFVSSTPAYVEKAVTIRPRVKAVTVAPTYKTVLLNQEVAPAELVQGSAEYQSFDRYGPGGYRSRDETLQGSVDCQRAGLFRHPKQCNKFYACRWDCTKQRFTLHVFNCPVQLSFDPSLGACNWPSQGPACQGDTLLTNVL